MTYHDYFIMVWHMPTTTKQKFAATLYMHRVAALLVLDWQTLMEKFSSGEIEDKIATRGFGCWRDEYTNAVF
jgi:hypothetical protein